MAKVWRMEDYNRARMKEAIIGIERITKDRKAPKELKFLLKEALYRNQNAIRKIKGSK